jgi:hypothetical protein
MLRVVSISVATAALLTATGLPVRIASAAEEPAQPAPGASSPPQQGSSTNKGSGWQVIEIPKTPPDFKYERRPDRPDTASDPPGYDAIEEGAKLQRTAEKIFDPRYWDRCFKSRQDEAEFSRGVSTVQSYVGAQLALRSGLGNARAAVKMNFYLLDLRTRRDSACLDKMPAMGTAPAQEGDAERPPIPPTGWDAPNATAAEALIDRAFTYWSSDWDWDIYRPGSAHVLNMDCRSGNCRVLGQFTFIRLGNPYTIGFTAALDYGGGGDVSVGRLCYSDTTTGMKDCIR